MGDWLFTQEQLENSPSFRDGISAKEERESRKKVADFINSAGRDLKLPLLTIATATVFMHRFFAVESFAKYSKDPNEKLLLGATCLFLGAKCEESPRKFSDVIPVVYRLMNPAQPPVKVDSQDYWDMKEKMTRYERSLLITLKFELQVQHPYKFLLTAASKLQDKKPGSADADAAPKNTTTDKNLRQVAWNFVNDSMRNGLTLCLQYHPKVVAGACIITACRLLKHRLPGDDEQDHEFWRFLHVELEVLQKVAAEVIGMYDKGGKKKSKQLLAAGGAAAGGGSNGNGQSGQGKAGNGAGGAAGGDSAAGAAAAKPDSAAAGGSGPQQQTNGAGGAASLALAPVVESKSVGVASDERMDVSSDPAPAAAAEPLPAAKPVQQQQQQSGDMDVVGENLARASHHAAAVVPKMVAELRGGGGADGTCSVGSGDPPQSLNSNGTTYSPTTMHMTGGGGVGGYKPVRGSSNGTKPEHQRHAPYTNASSLAPHRAIETAHNHTPTQAHMV